VTATDYMILTILHRAGLSQCGAQLEALLRGPTQWSVQNYFEERHLVIIIEIISYGKERGPKREIPS